MKKKPKVYLAGQPAQYENNWRETFKCLEGFNCYDPEFDSDQTSSETFFPQDLQAVKEAEFLVANPGIAPSEGTMIEIGYFYALNTKKPGEFCDKLIIIWKEGRPSWSIEFVKKAGHIVTTLEEAREKLRELTL